MVLNELPKGKVSDGSISGGNTVSAAFKAYSERLTTLDYASGHANARPNVIVARTFEAILDTVERHELLQHRRDAARRAALFAGRREAGCAGVHRPRSIRCGGRLWRSARPSFLLRARRASGLIDGERSPNTQPFIHTNPIMAPGGNGSDAVGRGPARRRVIDDLRGLDA